MRINRKYLGTGWSFPPQFNKNDGSVQMDSEETDIHNSIFIILSTRLGERVMRPSFGAAIEDLIFSPLDAILKTKMIDDIKTAIIFHEPRVKVINVDISQTDENSGKLIIILDYEIRATNSRFSEVHFELEGGVLKLNNPN